MHIGWAFETAALRHPELPGVVGEEGVLDYGGWYRRAAALAGWLRAQGVRPGDRVAMSMRNRAELATLYLAVQLAGAVCVPVNFRFPVRELGHVLADSGAVALFYDDSSGDAVHRLDRAPRLTRHVSELGAAEAAEPVASPPNRDTDLSVILYTAGTTGLPKGVPRTHRAEYAASVAHVVQCGYRPGERTLGAMPMAHTMGIRSLLAMILVNGLYVPVGSIADGPVLELLARHAVSSLYLVPTAYHLLLERLRREGTTLPACRRLAYAGAAMWPSLVEACVTAFDPEVFVNHYGSTEIYTFTVSDRQREKPGCAGRPGLHARIRLVTASRERRVGPEERVATGEVGEVIASAEGDEAFTGYLHRPEATEAALREGWYFTGDLGRLDAEGDLWVEGRVDDMIITGGENVYPIQVEDVIARHPEVAEVVVCGLPDERWGQVVTAFVVPRDERKLDADEILDYARRHPDLAAYQRPRRVVLVREIPKSPVGKILRRELLAGHYRELSPERGPS
ncbi:MAG TPA: AMP-binding protein [Candidatus Dormibacteraeota bacterium]|jgi:2-furoate---CoA ligase|nr:AMP-binding protein [Candidatus Dormibacteraeota bacterium]